MMQYLPLCIQLLLLMQPLHPRDYSKNLRLSFLNSRPLGESLVLLLKLP